MSNHKSKILSEDTAKEAVRAFERAIKTGVEFKLQKDVRKGDISSLKPENLIDEIPMEGKPLDEVMDEFNERFLPYCYNFASPNFMGFPDAGNSIAAITGNILADFLQQNLINQSFCSPSGTFAEIAVIRWLREVVGYKNPKNINDIFDAGGIITTGGTGSNAIGVMLARENYRANTMKNGVEPGDGYMLMVPKGIGHYSVKSGQMWAGCGNRLIEVETKDFRYDLDDLAKKLQEYKGKIMGVVAYAGDSRTMTVDNLQAVAEVVRASDQNIWLHADACHGFSLGFSNRLKHKLKGIELFDSITTDPHKVMNTPYTISALLVKDPRKLLTVASLSDLIMQEQYAFGQSTPFIGSKSWMSLKIWFAMKNIGKNGFEAIIDERHDSACRFAELVNETDDFVAINKVDINSVGFMYHGGKADELGVEGLNKLNKAMHEAMIAEGKYHLHQFSLADAGIFKKGELIYPHRYMSGNPNVTEEHMKELLEYLRTQGERILRKEKAKWLTSSALAS